MSAPEPGPEPAAAGVAVWPHVNGTIAVAVAQTNSLEIHRLLHRPILTDQAPQLIQQIMALIPPHTTALEVKGAYRPWIHWEWHQRQSCPVTRAAKTQAHRLALRALQSLRGHNYLRLPRVRWHSVPADLDPYTVATDASIASHGAAWAYVTGGGWYATGQVETDSIPLAEWVGICEALNLYPDSSKVKVLIDNKSACHTMSLLACGGALADWPAWLTPAAYKQGLGQARRLEVEAVWIPRSDHVLNTLADMFCRHVSRGLVVPTASSRRARLARVAY